MVARALEPIVRFLNPARDKWVGTGFLVQPRAGESGLFVMTCAHVVAAALGDKAVAAAPAPPEAEVALFFRDQTGDVYHAKVVPDAWRAVPDAPHDPGGAVDIAVLRLIDLDERPAGTGWPSFSAVPKPGRDVIALGPRNEGHSKLRNKAHWARGEITEPNRSDEVEFLTTGDIVDNLIFGGFSGGPLTDAATYEVLGMVRSVQGQRHRRAYAVPVALLSEVWSALLERRPRAAQGIHPIFDLIGRESQAGIVSRETRLRIEANTAGQASATSMTFFVPGPFEEDHAHMNRRALIEIAEHAERGNYTANIAHRPLKLPDGQNPQERLALLKEALLKETNAAGTSIEELGTALERGAPDGWLFHLSIGNRAGRDEGTVIENFLTFWDELTAATGCELYLHLSFTYDPNANDAGEVEKLHRSLAEMPENTFVQLQPLQPVGLQDISFWSQKIVTDGHVDDEGLAEELMYKLEDLMEGNMDMPMRSLRRAISREKIDLDNL